MSNGKFGVLLSSFGATILNLYLPDKNGKVEDCVLGFDTKEEYDVGRDKNPYFGAVVGRYANRIKGARYTLDGKLVKLDANEGKNMLHGGEPGTHRNDWSSCLTKNGIKFTMKSADGDQKWPGDIVMTTTYKLIKGELHMNLEAVNKDGKKSSPINMTNHSYFNLAGHKSTDEGVMNHILQIHADSYTELDSENIPTRKIINLKDDPAMDFRKGKYLI